MTPIVVWRRILGVGLCALVDDRGATAVEYGLIVAGVAISVAAAYFALGDYLATFFETISNTINNRTPT